MARLVCEKGDLEGQSFDIEAGLTLGRGPHNSIGMPKNTKASRDHAKVWKAGATQYAVADLGSTNGTLVNDAKVSRADLRDGDMVQVGTFVFRFELSEDERPKPKVRPAAASGGRDDLAAMLRGEAKPAAKATDNLSGAAAIEFKQRILQYNKKAGGGTAATQDIQQMGSGMRWGMMLIALAAAAALFLVVKGMISGGEEVREGQRPAAESER
jgi:hypothetical protein